MSIPFPLVIGSHAYRPEPLSRAPLDIDIIGTNNALGNFIKGIGKPKTCHPIDGSHIVAKYEDGTIIDGTIAYHGTSDLDLLNYANEYLTVKNFMGSAAYIAPPEVCFLLKESHKYKDSVHFEKTRTDVMAFRKRYGCSFETMFQPGSKLLEIYDKRCEETYRKPISLNVKKDDFFSNDGVKYIYDHDWLHELIGLNGPAYKLIQSDDADVLCSKEKWNRLPEIYKNLCVFEEAFVIAAERGVFPFQVEKYQDKRYYISEDFHKLYVKALQKICTSLTSGFFREYAWNNYDALKHLISSDFGFHSAGLFVERFNTEIPRYHKKVSNV